MQLFAGFQIDGVDDDVVMQMIRIGVGDDGELVALFAEEFLGKFDAHLMDFTRRKLLRFFRAEREDVVVIAAARRFTVELLHLVELFAEITGPHLGAADKTVAELFLLQQILLDSLRIAAARQGFKDGHG